MQLTPDQIAALNDLAGLLNAAVHGATVDPQAAQWALDIGPDLLESLSRIIERDSNKILVQEEEPKFALDGDVWFQTRRDDK
ncbi:MAG TPA: hypothetical protein VF210_10080 [Pseudomonadales bacterium]